MKKNINSGFVKNVKHELTDRTELVHIAKIKKPDFIERVNIDRLELDELADNINRNGLINPITVFETNNKFEIVAGHRRYLALKKLGAKKVKCNIITGTKTQLEMIKLSENLVRTDINDFEEAQMLGRLKKIGKLNEKQVAAQIGKSESYVKQKLNILKYPEDLQDALMSGQVVFSVARELMRLKDEDLITHYLKFVVKNGATPAIVKEWVDDMLHQQKVDKGLVEERSGSSGGLQIDKPTYTCWLCQGVATIDDSQLYRMHHKCVSAAMNGGGAMEDGQK